MTDRRGVIGVIDLSLLRGCNVGGCGEEAQRTWWTRWPFRTFIPIRGLIWRSNEWGTNQIDILPVVNRANVHKLEGIVTLREVLDAYGVNRA